MKRSANIIFFTFFCLTTILGQPKIPNALPEVDISKVSHSSSIPDHDMVYDPLIDDLIRQTNLDSLVSFVRILSGEDSVWINGSKERIQHRVSQKGNDLAADYIKDKLDSYNLEVHDQIYSDGGRNIYAVQPGILYSEKQYIICAHYDAVDDFAADDNASGVAGVLEAARILAQYDINYTLVYAFWDEEEIGLVGSSYYASQARANQSDIQGVLNMDMIGWDSNGDGLLDIHSSDVASSDSLANLLAIINSLYELDLNPVIYNPGTSRSDHSAFWNNEYGAVLVIEGHYGDDLNLYYHGIEDRIDKFDKTFFHNISQLSIGSIATLVGIATQSALTADLSHLADISVYPNPTYDILSIQSNYIGNQSIEIISLNGQLIYSGRMEGTSHQLDFSSFQKGVYCITISSEDFVTTRKLIKL